MTRERGPAGPVPTLFTTNSDPQTIPPADGRRPCDRCGKLTLRRIREGVRQVWRHSWCELEKARDYGLEDADTSVKAAEGNRPRRGSHKWAVLESLARAADGLNDFELGDVVGLQQNSCGKRRLELERLGFVEYAGFERPSPTGSPSKVWRITREGSSYWLTEGRSVAS